MLLEKLLKGFNYSTSTFNLKESKLFDQYFERILISKGTFLVKEGEMRGIVISFLMEYYVVGY